MDNANVIDVREWILRAAEYWPSLIISVAVCFGLAVATLLISDEKYEAKLVLAPVAEESAPSAGRFSGIANLAGIDIGQSNGIARFDEFMSLTTSPKVAQELMRRDDVARTIFSEQWDKERQAWMPRPGISAWIKRSLNSLFGLPAWTEPDHFALADYIDREMVVQETSDTGIFSLSLKHKDRLFAAQLLELLYTETEQILQVEAMSRTTRRIIYLGNRLDDLLQASHREVIIQLLLQEEQKMMLLEAGAPYAARILVQPEAAFRPVSPRPLISLTIGLLVGLLLGVFLCFCRVYFSMARNASY